MQLWNTISAWLGDGFSVFVYIAIVILFFIGVFSCLAPVSRNRKRLRRAISTLKQGDKAKRSWQDDRFLGKGSLMPHWSEYLNNLFFADGEYHNPANVEDYINVDTVITGPGRAKLSEALPGVQVSLGFLGTLLGLSLALSEMNSVDAATITSSMNTLLSSMKYAFLTSIFGVVASITFTLFTRAVHSKAENTLTEFYNAMSKHAGVLSVDPMTQVAIYQQEQTGLLKQLIELLSPENVREILSPLTRTVDITCDRQQQLMDQVAEAYIQKMNSALGGQFEQLSITIRDTCAYQEKALRGISDALVEFSDAAKAVHSIKDDTYALLDKYSRIIERMNSALDALSQGDEQHVKALGELKQLTNEFEAGARELKKLSESGAKSLETAGTALAESGEKLTGSISDAREKLSRDMDESLAYFEGCMAQIIKKVEKAAKAVSAAAEGLPSSQTKKTGGAK